MSEEKKFKFPTEIVELPSKGLLYPKDNPLSSGKVEMKYMTAKEEDILTNQNYIRQGIVLDKLMQSLIVSKCNYDDLVVGDKNAIMVASRILGYGKDYTFEYGGQEVTIDLSEIDKKSCVAPWQIKNGALVFLRCFLISSMLNSSAVGIKKNTLLLAL